MIIRKMFIKNLLEVEINANKKERNTLLKGLMVNEINVFMLYLILYVLIS